MLLAIDVGNTNIVLGLYDGTGDSAALIRERSDADRVVNNGAPFGTSATIFSSPDTSFFAVRRPGT